MDNLKAWGIQYISNREVHPNDAVMFDIDDTLIFTNGRSEEHTSELQSH
jgi:acid phosphatase class B